MLSQAEAIIYLAGQRGRTENGKHRSYHTFNFGSCFHESRSPFGNLSAINDETLASQSSLTHQVKSDSLIVLLPIVGTLNFHHSSENGRLEVGQSYCFFLSQGSTFEIHNTYENELINFLHIWVAAESAPGKTTTKSEVDLDFNKNQLMLLASLEKKPRISLGKFDGRSEWIVSLLSPQKGAFVFVIDGAFEVENRLLEARDGLALWNTPQLEFEALSNDAVILVIEESNA